MSKNIFIDSYGGNIIGALTDGSKLLEYRIEKRNQTVTIGSIFKGRVENILNGMQAAFVNIGLPRNGYLSVGDMLMDKAELDGKVDIPSTLNMKVGDEIMVQAIKDPAGSKGVRLTSHISFAGRYLVYMPTLDFRGVSRKITDEDERLRIDEILESLKSVKGGFIARTACEDAVKSDIKKEAKFLVSQYENITEVFETAKVTDCIYEEGNLAVRMLRDVYTKDIEKFYISDKDIFEKTAEIAKKCGSEVRNKMVLYNKKTDMFKEFGLDKDVETLLGSRVNLDNGAYLIIDKTEAMTVIDVNTGGFIGQDNLEETVFLTNAAAATEIARQLRLRNISGIIIVDFIDMTEEEHKNKILEIMKEAVADDRAKCNVIGMTGLGLMEITRKKKRRESNSMLVKDCPYCQGTGQIYSNDYIVMKIRVALLDLFAAGYNNAIIDLNIEIADYILSKGALKQDVEKIWTDKRVYIIPHKTYHQQFFLIKGDNNPAMEVPDKAIILY